MVHPTRRLLTRPPRTRDTPARPPRIRDMLTRPLRMLDTLTRPLPAPPERWRRGPLRDGAFTSPLRSPRLTSLLGVGLGTAFAICFVTGLISHFIQHPVGWLPWPAGPAWLYRVTQGVHVATGLATVPLLGAKLWSVYPKLFTWPPARSIAHALERGSVLLLVAAALFQIVTGVLNVARWYGPMGFFFTTAHYWTAWVAIGALLIHIAVQLPVIRDHLGRAARAETPPAGTVGGLSRRGLLGAVAASAAVVTVATVGQTVTPLGAVSVLGPRRPDQGPQGLPVNKSAVAAGVVRAATDPGYRLRLTGPAGTRLLSLADLRSAPQHTTSLPIACVEGWSATARWTGPRIRDLATLAGVPGRAHVTVHSLEKTGRYGTSTLPPDFVDDPSTLLALAVHGQPLALDHGYPARLIAPNRPGVLQTKWIAAIVVEPA
jgi:DMSO/TMAO reductase YedYZ molybdopterin-dependent catalytic subunit